MLIKIKIFSQCLHKQLCVIMYRILDSKVFIWCVHMVGMCVYFPVRFWLWHCAHFRPGPGSWDPGKWTILCSQHQARDNAYDSCHDQSSPLQGGIYSFGIVCGLADTR